MSSARAEFLQSQVERREYRHGNEIARLERTVKMAREGIEFSKTKGFVKVVDGPSLLGKFPENLQSLLMNAKQRRKASVDENNSIYHEQVPSCDSMTKIEGMDTMEYNGDKDCDLPLEFMPQGLKRPMFASVSS
jgi:BRO1-like domain.